MSLIILYEIFNLQYIIFFWFRKEKKQHWMKWRDWRGTKKNRKILLKHQMEKNGVNWIVLCYYIIVIYGCGNHEGRRNRRNLFTSRLCYETTLNKAKRLTRDEKKCKNFVKHKMEEYPEFIQLYYVINRCDIKHYLRHFMVRG